MPEDILDLLSVTRGAITAPAGCGKTHLIAEALKRHDQTEVAAHPILVLTHTNAGVAALRQRLNSLGVSSSCYRLSTIDGWAVRLAGMFPKHSGVRPQTLLLAHTEVDYPAVRRAALLLLQGGHIHDLIKATYSFLIVDEYQDCSIPQHAIICSVAAALPTCILGDPMQAIFGWQGNPLPDWGSDVCAAFPVQAELRVPYRWRNAQTDEFGEWLLEVRRKLLQGDPVNLEEAPPEVSFVLLEGGNDRERQLSAARNHAFASGTVIIIGNSKSPASQRELASQIPGAVTVEAVDLKDLVRFAREFDINAPDALGRLTQFAASVMTNVGPADLLRRIRVLERGAERRAASDVEQAALRFKAEPNSGNAVDFLVSIGKEGGVRTYRPTVLRCCISALNACGPGEGEAFYHAVISAKEQYRALGRGLPRVSVGSTLLVKGLEADTSVAVDITDMCVKNLYVAMTRGSKRLVICARSPIIGV